ncbi:MAG TPA: Mur ligase family protein [Actinomycetota bacterium]|nr:Mur ligase family protein [Actinomycetota bacterium]
MRFDEAVADLDRRGQHRIVPGLERIAAITELLDHPQRTYPSIHVAGTNGKTTTTRLAGRILCAHGLAAGVYTSPHLSSVTERIALCDAEISEPEFAEAYAHLKPFLDDTDRAGGQPVTYFEALTALAFLWFADKPVDAAVLEVGMGGRWDATNVVEAPVAVVCPVSLDHPELGPTVADVAGEKAAIIKPEATAIVRRQTEDAMEVIEARIADGGADAKIEDRDFGVASRDLAVGGQRLAIQGLEAEYPDLLLPLHGEHQAENAAAAVAAGESLLGRALDEGTLRDALADAAAPGRLETVARHPLVVLDGAHNVDAAGALAAAIGEALVWRRLHLVVGILETKDAEGIVAALAPRADAAYATRNSNPRSLDGRVVADHCERAGVSASVHDGVAAALEAAHAEADADDLILVTGSLYTVADARPRYVTP